MGRTFNIYDRSGTSVVGDVVSEAPFLRLRVDRVREPVAHFWFVTALCQKRVSKWR